MNHEKIREKLYAFFDGELPEWERAALSAHLEGCAECRRTCEDWKRIAGALFYAPPAQPSEAFVQKVMGALPGRDAVLGVRDSVDAVPPTPSAISLRWLVPAFGIAFIALILILARPAEPETVSAETLLLANGNGREGAVTELAFLPESPGRDEILGYVLEE